MRPDNSLPFDMQTTFLNKRVATRHTINRLNIPSQYTVSLQNKKKSNQTRKRVFLFLFLFLFCFFVTVEKT